MRAHSQSEVHIQPYEAELAVSTAMQVGSIAQHLQHIGEQERMKNRVAIKALICCTHFLARRHIPHMTNFDELFDLIVNCGAEDFRRFFDSVGRNATYTSKVAVVEFVKALGV